MSEEQKSHIAVQFKDAIGNPIDPAAPDPQPYSPRMTCGGCHPYETIAGGYHFTLGADSISDDHGMKSGRPWIISDGMAGSQQHMSYAWICKKKNKSEAEVGMTPYQYSQTCGVCHAGGGLMETDRDGQRYDVRQSRNPEIAESFDGDYHKAAWDKSGVVEVDCLMCHQAGYDAKARNDQLAKANFKWASTAGAGLGSVTGSVASGETPKLTYATDRFSGALAKLIISKPTDQNCLQCHGEAEVKKRGHVWDGRADDVHSSAGLKCIACHSSGLDHQFAKGRSNEVRLRDDLDSDKVSCISCHSEGRLDARKPAHNLLPADHLDKIACVTCHVRDSNVTAVLAVDTTTGKTAGIPTSWQAKKYGESFRWQPAYFRLSDGKIYSGNALLPVWWGNRVGKVIHPLTLPETGKAYESVKDQISDDNGDGKAEANTDAEMKAMLGAMSETLRGGRFTTIRPTYVKGDKVYELKAGRLVISGHPQASPLRWTMSHNVSPASKALGAGGCADCHGADSSFFNSPVTTDPYGSDGRPVTVPMWQYLGLKPDVLEADK